MDEPWRIDCSGGSCGGTDYPIFTADVRVPGNIAHFDLVVTITLEYTISEGDSSRLHIFYCPNTLPQAPCPLSYLQPGTFTLSSPGMGKRNSTSLSWSGSTMSAEYSTWHYELFSQLEDTGGGGRVSMSGSQMTVVFEMWPTQG
jgi:hypothetical protein